MFSSHHEEISGTTSGTAAGASTTTAAHHWRYASANAPIEARTSLSAAPTASAPSEREVLASIGALAEAYRQWCATVVVLAPAAVPEVVPEISSWCEENMSATSPVRAAVDQAM